MIDRPSDRNPNPNPTNLSLPTLISPRLSILHSCAISHPIPKPLKLNLPHPDLKACWTMMPEPARFEPGRSHLRERVGRGLRWRNEQGRGNTDTLLPLDCPFGGEGFLTGANGCIPIRTMSGTGQRHHHIYSHPKRRRHHSYTKHGIQ